MLGSQQLGVFSSSSGRVKTVSDSKVKITIKNNGPIRVEGGAFELCDSEGKVFSLGGRAAVSICRCGHSQKQPFCDGSHSGCEFKSEVKAFDLPAK